jgi:NAD(P)-dependent dehydrogenase (short-subunit alcohol dehydrogenase family)
MKLEDLKIIVTGGAQGMGAHFALALARGRRAGGRGRRERSGPRRAR